MQGVEVNFNLTEKNKLLKHIIDYKVFKYMP